MSWHELMDEGCDNLIVVPMHQSDCKDIKGFFDMDSSLLGIEKKKVDYSTVTRDLPRDQVGSPSKVDGR